MLETKPQRVLRCVIFSLAFFCPLAIIIENFERTKTGEAFTAAVARNSILANSIFRCFPYNFQYLSCQRQAKQILGKKPVQDRAQGRPRQAGRVRETAAVRARQIDINMACPVMDPLKCTTIAVKSKNASAFVFIVA